MTEKICIIGAGSSGIVAAKVLKQNGLPFDCFEKGSGIGGNWRYRNDNGQSAAYRSLHINTSKTRMAYSDFPMPETYPDFPGHADILRYFENYVDHFGFRDNIRFQTSVEEVRPAEGSSGEGHWQVTTSDGKTETYRAVLVANGHHWNPRWPEFPGEFDGEVMHAHSYDLPTDFADKRVLVVGIGNSGVDIACETSRVAEACFLSTRRSAYILPKYAFGVPLDLYTTPSSSRLPTWLQKHFFKAVLKISRGSQQRFGVPEPEHHILAAHPTISADLLHLVGHGEIKVKPNIERLMGDRVRFADGTEEKIDKIVYATGYKITFPFFKEDFLKLQDGENRVRLFRHVVHPDHPGLYFIGLVQPLGAIMPLAEAQSEWIANVLSGKAGLPDRSRMEAIIEKDLKAMAKRYVTSARHTIQVDFYPYLRDVQYEMRRQPAG